MCLEFYVRWKMKMCVIDINQSTLKHVMLYLPWDAMKQMYPESYPFVEKLHITLNL